MYAAERCLDGDARLDSARVLVTGATDGIGRETALALGRRGATVLVHGRSESKAQATMEALSRTDGGGEGPYLGDFADLDAVRDLAERVESAGGLDVLVNNAGATFDDGAVTDLGIERTLHVNHLAPFVLTTRLLPLLRSADGPHGEGRGRVVVVASEAHRGADLDLDAVESVEDYDGLDAYRRSKLANLAFTFELARRVDIPVNATHPGFVPGSALWRDVSLPFRTVIALLRRLPSAVTPGMVKTEADGAAPSVYLAAAAETADWSGEYVTGCRTIDATETARDEALQSELWAWSAAVTGEGLND